MEVILLTDVKGQGKKGAVIKVADGYATNYLFPKKLAVKADASALSVLKSKEDARLHKIEGEKAAANELAARLAAITIKLVLQSGGDGKLYGSVTAKEIADKLQKDYGIEIDKRKLVISEPIKSYGTYAIEVKLYTGIQGKINLVIADK